MVVMYSKVTSGDDSTSSSPTGMLDSMRRKCRKFRSSVSAGGSGDEDAFSSEQFDERPLTAKRIPIRAIALAAFLLVAGTIALILSLASLAGRLPAVPHEGPYVLATLGLLMFIPGFYHVRIALYAYRRTPGYSFDDIPDFD